MDRYIHNIISRIILILLHTFCSKLQHLNHSFISITEIYTHLNDKTDIPVPALSIKDFL